MTRAFSLDPLFCNPLDGANGKTLVSVASKSSMPLRPEVEAGRELRFCIIPIGDRKGRPVVAAISVRIKKRSPSNASCRREEDAGGGVDPFAPNQIPRHTVRRRSGPFALAAEINNLLICRHTPATSPLHMRRIIFRREIAIHCRPPFIP